MKRPFLLILASFTLVLQIGCGGGGGGSSSGSYTTHVEIVLGKAQTVSLETGTPIKASDQIPASVSQIRFTISAPDMQPVTRSVPVAGRSTITESFEVPMGASRRFLVESLDPESNVIFRGEAVVNVGAEPLFLTISLVNTDPLPPVFSGLSAITGITTTTMVLNWLPATDNVTDPGKIQYLIYAATARSGENFANPTVASSPGANSYTVTNLNPATTYYFVVRAIDEHGNVDGNSEERSAATSSLAISGTINFGSGTFDAPPVVTITLSGAANATTTRDTSGNYSFTGLANGSYSVTPSMTGYTFTPASRSVTVDGADVTAINFTAMPATYTISGMVTYTIVLGPGPVVLGLAGVTMTLSGAANATTTTDASGNYSFTGLANGSYSATPSSTGYYFTPTSHFITVNGAIVTADFTAYLAVR
jgi:predicted phage tail protein